MKCITPYIIILLAAISGASVRGEESIGEPGQDQAGIRFFETKVRPLLVEHCYECHGPDSGKGEADLRVDSLEGLLKGGLSGPALTRGEPSQSLLMFAVKHDGAVAMPPKKKLPQAEIDALGAWIKMGAPWPGSTQIVAAATAKDSPNQWDEEARQFWAFQPIRAVEPPDVHDAEWSASPIDRFVLARLNAAGLKPVEAADKNTLLRRVTLDLLGVPPTPAEVDAFLNDHRPDAFEHVVNRLLESPLYGERWGRHWLDVARYADSNGMDDNLAYSDAWRYRDYVITSLNTDKPFNRFIHEQLAGDILAGSDPERRDELVVATGFLTIGPKMLAEDDPVKQQLDIVDEQLDTTCRVLMGLTMGCARCHDHKYDPLSLSDYYSLAGIFSSTKTMITFRVDSKWNTTGLGSVEAALRLEDLEQIADRHDNALVNGNTLVMTPEERTAHANLLDKVWKEYALIPKAMAVTEGEIGDLEIRLRGNHLTRGAAAPRRFPSIFASDETLPITASASGRWELAKWLTSDSHPLPARVLVNRVWRWHFGQGLVRTVDNFGKLGETPSHPELLDFLSRQFIAEGWSLKKLHRHILLSKTWQMSTARNEQAAQLDPDNRLLWHRSRQRMEAEVLRDSLLSVSGLLDPGMGGPAMESTPFQNLSLGGLVRKPELYQSTRRSVYLPVLRGAVYDVFQAFDYPDPAILNGDRATTTVASQALFMMNGELVHQAARKLGETITAEPLPSDRDRLQQLCQRLFCRAADDDELEQWSQFLTQYQLAGSLRTESEADRRKLAWEGLCRALLSSNEFIYIN
ncbi:DUF1553 domain-containing protein [Schlesneria sp.]|uniref:DUF1553 domain-containing protein n=1 Tax=Schlesneria sp. TaxID=2762018 RepID=UPI002EE91114